jgi:hypothetical protein
MPFELKLRRNLDYHEGAREPKYFFVFELELGEVIGRPVSSRLPVFWRPNDIPHPILKEFYWVDIAGVRVEKGNLAALEKAVPHAVLGLLDFGTIPYYYISIPGGDRLPVFLKEGKLRLRGNGAPSRCPPSLQRLETFCDTMTRGLSDLTFD